MLKSSKDTQLKYIYIGRQPFLEVNFFQHVLNSLSLSGKNMRTHIKQLVEHLMKRTVLEQYGEGHKLEPPF